MTAIVHQAPRRRIPIEWFAYGALLLAGGVVDALCEVRPAELPVWMPWEFSWPVYLVTALTLVWFLRGLAALPRAERPSLWRSISFVIGVLSFYAVLQTRFDYLAQHMFFFHRLAHFVLHHLGAMLIAAGMAAPALRAGMPDFMRIVVDWRFGRRALDFLQHPAVAPVQFIGLLYLWLIPQIHTRVMLDRDLYDLMNWSMGLSGILFWSLIMDPRASPPARLSFLLRFLLILAIELPQMIVGAILSLSSTDYYPVYRICGRILNMTALNDQHYGGLIIWLPGTLTSFVAVIALLMALRIHEEETERARLEN